MNTVLGFGHTQAEVMTVEVLRGPRGIGIAVGPHKGTRNVAWLSPGAVADLKAALARAEAPPEPGAK